MSKKSKNIWFTKVRGSYLPKTWQAWALYVPFTAYLVTVTQTAIRQDSVSDALYLAFPQFVCAGIVMTWIASKTSK